MRTEADICMKAEDIDAFAYRLQYECNKLKDIMRYCVEVGLLHYDKKDTVFYSERLQQDTETMRAKSKQAKQSAELRRKARESQNDANALPTHSERNAKKEKKGKEKKRKEISTSVDTTPVGVRLTSFDQFYSKYPRKEAKKFAQTAFEKALKTTTLDKILE